MRAIGYRRVSGDPQEHNTSLTSQTQSIERAAEKEGDEIIRMFEDVDSGADESIPGFLEMLDFLQAGGAERLYIDHPDRLSRNLLKKLIFREQLKKVGVDVRYVSLPVENTPEGRLVENMFGSWAEYERERIAFRTNRGRYAKAERGMVVGTGLAPYGLRYLRHTDEITGKSTVVGLELDADTAPVVLRIFELLVTESTGAVATTLNDEGIPAPAGGPWVGESLVHIARNPVYYGMAAYGRRHRTGKKTRPRPADQWVTTSVPPIVSRDLWDQVQEALHARATYRRAPRIADDGFVLRGRLVCGHCGGSLACETRHGIRVYSCLRRKTRQAHRQRKPRCVMLNLHAEPLEDIIWESVAAAMTDPSSLRLALVTMQAQEAADDSSGRRAIIDRELWRYRNRLRQANDLLLDAEPGTATWDDLRAKATDAQQQITRLESERDGLAQQAPTVTAEALASLDAFAATVGREIEAQTDDDKREWYERLHLRVTVWLDDEHGAYQLGKHRYAIDPGGSIPLIRGSSEDDFKKFYGLLPLSIPLSKPRTA